MNKISFDIYCTDLLDKTNDLIFFLSLKRKLEWANACWLKSLEYSLEEVEGHALESFIDKSDKKVFLSAVEQVLEHHEPVLFEFSFISKSGKRIIVDGELEMAKDEEGRYLRGIFRDVTKHKTIQRELQESRSRVEIFFQNTPEAIAVVDQHLNVVAWNKKAEEIFGYTADEITGKPSEILIPERYKQQYKFAVSFFLKTGFSPVLNKALERKVLNKKHEEFPIRITISNIKMKDQLFFMGFITDISKTKKMEEQLQKKESELLQSKLLDEKKDEFLSIASHELKTPLTTIKAYAQIALKQAQVNSDKSILEYLEKINIHTSKLNYLIRELLDVSKIHSGKLTLSETVIDFSSYLQEVIHSIQHVTPSHKINLDINNVAQVYIDPLRVEQVITNLINNAAKYSPGKGSIEVSANVENGNIVVAIKDHGIGIPEKNRKKLFSRFYRVEETSKSYSGLGIGLFISKEIIKQHKGKLWVESEEGRGSVFYFSLPVYKK